MKVIKGAIFFLVMISHSGFAQSADSLDIKIGQMILIGMPSAKVDSAVLREVRLGKVGSVILFEKNIPAKNSYTELKKMTWTYQEAAPIPLFIAIDQEGGKVNRLKEKYGFPRSISAAKLGKYGIDSVRFYAEITAATLAGLGINVNFAPVVDLASNPSNPIIAGKERAFSADPDSVALFAREIIEQHRKLGIVTSLKHFPGHGSSKDDTHLGIADVTNTWNEKELIPYQALIDSGFIDAIMTAHIVNKNLDEKALPGTLSKKITNDLLRGKLHYNGVVFSDDMQMHAIAKHYPLEEAILLAINAGVDILTFSNNIAGSQERAADKVHQIIRKFVEEGKISEQRIDQSFDRIMLLKTKLNGKTEEYYRKELVRAQELARQNEEMALINEARAKMYAEKAAEKAKQEEGQKKEKRKKKKSKSD
ncbi:MAG: glycoside hydrolase family 3 protein [Cyclobacteriaceae bacterium]